MAYIDKRKTKGNKTQKIITKMSIGTICNLWFYVMSESDYITKTNLLNLKKLLDMIDINRSYDVENELPTIQYFNVLSETVNAILEEYVDDFDELFDYLVERSSEEMMPKNTIRNLFEKLNRDNQMSSKKVLYWNKYIQTNLDYASIYNNISDLKEIVETFEHTDPQKIEHIIPKAKETLTVLSQSFNRNVMSTESKRNSFNPLDRNNARNIIGNSLNSMLNPGNKISTGYRMFDEMLGGGLQEGRCYLLLGQSKGFKSGTVLNIVMNVATHYVDYQLKDPTKIPCVLYFTMENSMNETFERIYNYLGIDFDFPYEIIKNKMGREIKKYKITEEDIDKILDVIQKETYEKTGIVLRIEFKEHMSVDTGVLETFYENYSILDNQEIIFIAQDYIKRIHSQRVYRTEQKRDELGEVINEFCNFAKDKNIPILTISQLNRAALSATETKKINKKKDIIRGMGASFVGESNLVYENADYTILTGKEEDEDDGRTYQTFHLAMARGKSYRNYFAQPFDPNPIYKGFRIAVDIDLPNALGKERISSISDVNDINAIENSAEAIENRRNKKSRASINIDEILKKGQEIKIDENESPLNDFINDVNIENELK